MTYDSLTGGVVALVISLFAVEMRRLCSICIGYWFILYTRNSKGIKHTHILCVLTAWYLFGFFYPNKRNGSSPDKKVALCVLWLQDKRNTDSKHFQSERKTARNSYHCNLKTFSGFSVSKSWILLSNLDCTAAHVDFMPSGLYWNVATSLASGSHPWIDHVDETLPRKISNVLVPFPVVSVLMYLCTSTWHTGTYICSWMDRTFIWRHRFQFQWKYKSQSLSMAEYKFDWKTTQ